MMTHAIRLEIDEPGTSLNAKGMKEASRRPSTGAELANIILAIWLPLSPFVLGFSQNVAAKWSNIAVGIALVIVALAGGWGNEIFEGLAVPLAAWLFMSPFLLGFWKWVFMGNNVGMAFVIIAAAAISEGLRVPDAVKPLNG